MYVHHGKRVQALTVWLLLSVIPAAGAAESGVDAAQQEQMAIDDLNQQTQEKIDRLSQKAREMLAAYRAAKDETSNLRIYNEQLSRQVESQEQELASLREQLNQIDRTQQAFVPNMLEALDALKRFVERDIPFKLDERRAELDEIEALMGRADVTTAEQYRQLMEAYKRELKYGRTIETYRGELSLDGDNRSVRFLRVGRIALLYQTLDQQRTGRWNPQTDQWEDEGDADRAAFEKGYKIASEQAPPDLLKAPVNPPEGE